MAFMISGIIESEIVVGCEEDGAGDAFEALATGYLQAVG